MTKKRKINAILNFIAFIGVLIINALAVILPINGITTAELSDSYPNLFVPAGVTFSIWGVIYLLLLIYSIYQLRIAFSTNEKEVTVVEKIGYLFFISSIGNMAWILAWQYKHVILSIVIMLIFLVSLIMLYEKLKIERKSGNKKIKYMICLPFSIYLGWLSIATIANITAALVYIKWDGFGINPVVWTVIVIIVGILLGLIFVYRNKDIYYAMVVDWALLGIYIKRSAQATDSTKIIIWVAVFGMIILTSGIIYQIYKKETYMQN